MLFFQFTTNGVLFKPVNLTNIILQNSYIIIMALGMLLVIVAGHIDLSVGSVSGFIGAVAAMMMMVELHWHSADPGGHYLPHRRGHDRGVAGLSDRLSQDPVLHRDAGGHADLQGPVAGHPGRQVGRPVPGRIPAAQRRLHSRCRRPDHVIPQAEGTPPITLHSTTLIIGILVVVGMVFSGLRTRKRREGARL